MTTFEPRPIKMRHHYEDDGTSELVDVTLVRPNMISAFLGDELYFRVFPRSLVGEEIVDYSPEDTTIKHFTVFLHKDELFPFEWVTSKSLVEIAEYILSK